MKGKSSYIIVIAGLCCLAIAMGIGRFAYTPLLPLMQEAEQFTSVLAGNLASLNYIGYLVGAVIAGLAFKRSMKRLNVFLVISILTTLLMGLTANVTVWMFLRFVSGIASGLIFVFSTSIVLDELSKRGQTRLSGILYGGVGVGILLSGIVVPLLPSPAFWNLGWYVLGGICIVFFVFVLIGFRGLDGEVKVAVLQSNSQYPKQKKLLQRLYISYGCEGFGYIICATFLISMITKADYFSWHPATVWAAVGVAAIPSCIIWAKLGNCLGDVIALRLAYVLQIIGVLMPIMLKHDVIAIIGAALFGATFMGITTLSITIGKEIFVGSSTKVISSLTVFYGIGQILGPTISGFVAFVYNGYEGAMALSAVVLIIALLSIQSSNFKEVNINAIRKH